MKRKLNTRFLLSTFVFFLLISGFVFPCYQVESVLFYCGTPCNFYVDGGYCVLTFKGYDKCAAWYLGIRCSQDVICWVPQAEAYGAPCPPVP